MKSSTIQKKKKKPFEVLFSLVRLLANVVTRRVVVTSDENSGTVLTDQTCASEPFGVTPHHLSVMTTHSTSVTRVGVVVVGPAFDDP